MAGKRWISLAGGWLSWDGFTAIVGVSMTARPHGRQCWGRYTGPNWCFGHKDPLAPYPRLPCPWLLAPGIGRDWIDGKWCQCSVTVTPSDLKRLRTSREPREVWWMSSGEPPKGPGLQASCQLCEWNSTGLPRTVKEQRESDPLAPRRSGPEPAWTAASSDMNSRRQLVLHHGDSCGTYCAHYVSGCSIQYGDSQGNSHG
ncbi:hypothetical protein B0T09DRAFT_318817 [Sordaria sp. MPI-SDFR-AT-0083]|nr:hypothetical protein B0T09DRAFT_318817 [Sordaria sp. MPI-SDFR-AT-0083]